MTHSLVLYAPNVHTGGGFVLLRSILATYSGATPLTAFLDERAKDKLTLPENSLVSWVKPRATSRLKAEFDLRKAATVSDRIVCFHGLPPLLPHTAEIVVFQQNRNYFGLNSLAQFSWKTRLRLSFERLVSKAFRHRVSSYIVQTPSMQRALTEWYAAPAAQLPMVTVFPFVEAMPAPARHDEPQMKWDFVYVADGEAHKNHLVLLEAWRLLADEGLFPSLALTLSPRDGLLKSEIEETSLKHDLKIHDIGQLSHKDVMALYAKSRALIFPSTSESFGLPLIEASHMGLPILASELDFVRDVCVPEHTFDPASPVSIARAVKRFLGHPEHPIAMHAPSAFWEALSSGSGR